MTIVVHSLTRREDGVIEVQTVERELTAGEIAEREAEEARRPVVQRPAPIDDRLEDLEARVTALENAR